ncbi:MAG: EAL domain-containing protein [Lachnospiraceae bacterium]|nr:EAL domain-containing protein [Lachnospiraceae bacterium]
MTRKNETKKETVYEEIGTLGVNERVLLEGIRRERERINLISSLFDEWIFEYDCKTGGIISVNATPEQYDIPIINENGREGLDLSRVHPEDVQGVIDTTSPHIAETSETRNTRKCDFRLRTGHEWKWYSLSSVYLYDREGNVVSVIGKVTDIDEKKQEELRLYEKAQRDSLTGLYNRQAFEEKAFSRLENVKNGYIPHLAVIIIDIDNFKLINDNFGHLFGDLAIIEMTNALKMCRFATDIIGRFGGDEFIVVTTDYKDKEDLEKKVKELREQFTSLMHEEYADASFSCSIGISFYGEDGDEYNTLLGNADKALYFAKTHGRNSYVFCNQVIRETFIPGNPSERKKIILPGKSVSDEIVQFALDLFESTADIMSAVSILLGRVGRRFNLSFVSLREKQNNGSTPIKYVWYDEKRTSFKGDEGLLPAADWVTCNRIFSGSDNLLVEDVASMEDENPLRQLMQKKSVKAFIKEPLVSAGEGFGCLTFGDCFYAREWTEEEQKSFSVISRILSTYLVREKDYNRVQKEMERMMSYDDVTGLLKFDKFKEVSDEIISLPSSDKFAVLAGDIAHFKFFNESHGFKIGDQVLRDFAAIIIKHNPRIVASCRDYADNFLALIRVQDGTNMEELIAGNCERFKINETRKYSGSQFEVNIGYYVIDESSMDIAHAIDNANFAKKALKESGTSGIRRYEPNMKADKLKEVALLHTLEEAMDEEQFEVFLQPQVDLASGELSGAEALVRWRKPDGTLGFPDDFIPLLEKSGKIVNLDYYVFESVLRLLRRWRQENKKMVPISVNFSRKHIKNDVFVPYITRQTEHHSIDKKYVEIEITESAFVDDQVALRKVMSEVREAGFRLAVDDFGKGYSSLSMINEVPAEVIKIDKEFLKNYEEESQKAMLNNVIRLIKDAAKTVVCEGIEEEAQARFLAQAGCDIGQGYWFGRPMPIEDFENRFMTQNSNMLSD